jgi:hypothetical protein
MLDTLNIKKSLFLDRASLCSPSWPQPPDCWDYRHVPHAQLIINMLYVNYNSTNLEKE